MASSIQDTDEQKYESRLVRLLLLPSWLSGLSVSVVGLAVVVTIIGLARYRSSDLQLLIALQNENSPSVNTSYQTAHSTALTNSLVNNLPLFIFWAGVGLIVYWLMSSIISTLNRAVTLKSEMDYVNIDRKILLRHALGRSIIRVVILLGWFFFARFTLHVVVPYVIAIAYVATGTFEWLIGIGYFLCAAGLLAVCLHVHIILLRLLFMRPRLFGRSTYIV